MLLTAAGILEADEGDTEINRETGEAVKQELILSNVDKCFKLPNSHSSRKYCEKVCIHAVIECEIVEEQAAVPFSADKWALHGLFYIDWKSGIVHVLSFN